MDGECFMRQHQVNLPASFLPAFLLPGDSSALVKSSGSDKKVAEEPQPRGYSRP